VQLCVAAASVTGPARSEPLNRPDRREVLSGAPELPNTTQAAARPPNSPPASMDRMKAGSVLGVRASSRFNTRNCVPGAVEV